MSSSRTNQKQYSKLIVAPWDNHKLVFLAPFSHTLADRTTLQDPINSHLTKTIRQVLYSQCRREEDPNKINPAVDGACRTYVTLVQWMKLRGIEYFQLLSSSDISSFLVDFSKGRDHLLHATPRLAAYLDTLSERVATEIRFKSAMENSGLPSSLVRLVGPTALFRFFKENKKLPNDISSLEEQVTIDSIKKAITDISRLHREDGSLEDGLSFIPNVNGEYSQLAERLGKPQGSTRTIPDDLAVRMISASINWIVNIAPILLNAERELSQITTCRNRTLQFSAIIEKVNESAREAKCEIIFTSNGTSVFGSCRLNTAITSHLRAACFFVMITFTGRRYSEIEELEKSALVGSTEHGFWLEGPIGKRAMNDRTPCSPIVALAVGTLMSLHAIAGTTEVNGALFTLTRAHTQDKERYELPFRSEMLQKFAELEGLDTYYDGDEEKTWKYAPHQCRRFFALVYFWRYDNPHLTALAHHFRHLHLKMTRTYVKDVAFKKIMMEEQKRLTTTKLRDIASGNSKAHGILGKSLSKSLDRMRKIIDIGDSKAVINMIDRLITRRRLSLSPTPWGFCGANSEQSNIKRAACQQNNGWRRIDIFSGRPDADGSSEELCAKCLFLLTDDSRESHWKKKIESLEKSINAAPANSLVKEAISARCDTIKAFYRNTLERK